MLSVLDYRDKSILYFHNPYRSIFSQKLALNHFLLRDEIISRTCYLYYSQLARLELCFQLHQSLITLKIIIVPAICLTLFPYQIFYSRLLVYSLYCGNSYLVIEQIRNGLLIRENFSTICAVDITALLTIEFPQRLNFLLSNA